MNNKEYTNQLKQQRVHQSMKTTKSTPINKNNKEYTNQYKQQRVYQSI